MSPPEQPITGIATPARHLAQWSSSSSSSSSNLYLFFIITVIIWRIKSQISGQKSKEWSIKRRLAKTKVKSADHDAVNPVHQMIRSISLLWRWCWWSNDAAVADEDAGNQDWKGWKIGGPAPSRETPSLPSPELPRPALKCPKPRGTSGAKLTLRWTQWTNTHFW